MERLNAAMLNRAMISGPRRHPAAATLPRQRVRSSTPSQPFEVDKRSPGSGHLPVPTPARPAVLIIFVFTFKEHIIKVFWNLKSLRRDDAEAILDTVNAEAEEKAIDPVEVANANSEEFNALLEAAKTARLAAIVQAVEVC